MKEKCKFPADLRARVVRYVLESGNEYYVNRVTAERVIYTILFWGIGNTAAITSLYYDSL